MMRRSIKLNAECAGPHSALRIDGITTLRNGISAVSGWVVDFERTPVDIQVGKDGGCLCQSEKFDRPDVEAHFARFPEAKVFGFYAELPGATACDINTLIVVTTFSDGTSIVREALVDKTLPLLPEIKNPLTATVSSGGLTPSFGSLRREVARLSREGQNIAEVLGGAPSKNRADSENFAEFFHTARAAAAEAARRRTVEKPVTASLLQARYYDGLQEESRPQNHPLNICIVTTDIVGPIFNGGMGTFHTSLAEVLRDAGHRVTILYEQGTHCEHHNIEHWISVYARRGLTLIPIKHEAVELQGSRPLRRSYHVYQWLKQRRFDWIHFHEMVGLGYYSVLAAHSGVCFPDTTICVGVHSPTVWHMTHDRQFLSHQDLIELDYMERESVRLADVVFSPSKGLLHTLHASGWSFPEQTYVLAQPLRQAEISPHAGNANSLHDVEELAFFGRLETRKGLTLFCRALDIVSRHLTSPLRVSFLGKIRAVRNIPSDQFIAERAENWNFDVNVYGNFPREEALRYLQRPGVLAVLPSLEDNGPYTVYECLASGIPFVTTNVGGIPEIIADEDHPSALVDICPHQLADRLLNLIASGARRVRPRVPFEIARKRWQEFHSDPRFQRQARVTPPRATEAEIAVAVFVRSEDFTLKPLLDRLTAERGVAKLYLLECSPGLLSSPGINSMLAEVSRTRPGIRLIPCPGSEGLRKAFADWDTPYVLLLDEDVLPSRGATELLTRAMEAAEADFATSFVAMCDEHEGETTSTKLFLGNSPSASVFYSNTGGSGALLRREALLGFASLRELTSRTDIFWELFNTLQTLGEKGVLIPEPLFSERFSSRRFEEHNEALNCKRALQPLHEAHPRWAGPLLTMAHGMALRMRLHPRLDLSGRNEKRFVAERFACAENTLLKAEPETRFLPLQPFRDIQVYRGSERLSCIPRGAFPQLMLQRFSMPLSGNSLYLHLDVHCLKDGRLKLHLNRSRDGLNCRSESQTHDLREGRNRVWLELDKRDLIEPITLELAPEGGRYDISLLELRHSSNKPRTRTVQASAADRKTSPSLFDEISEKKEGSPERVQPELSILLPLGPNIEPFLAAAKVNAPYWRGKREVIVLLNDPSLLIRLEVLKSELEINLRGLTTSAPLPAVLSILAAAAEAPFCFLHGASLQYCGDVPGRLLGRARDRQTLAAKTKSVFIAPLKLLKSGDSIAAKGETSKNGGVFFERSDGVSSAIRLEQQLEEKLPLAGTIAQFLEAVGGEEIICPEALLVQYEAENRTVETEILISGHTEAVRPAGPIAAGYSRL